MTDLRQVVEKLGAEDVSTYVQSGNVVCRSALAPAKFGQALEKGIRGGLGLEVEVLVRTAAQLASIVDRNPFLPDADPAKLHVTFLASAPDAERARGLNGGSFAPDELRVAEENVFLHCPNGYGRSKLSNAFIEKQLAVAATTRNWTTVSALAELTAGLA